MFFIKECVKSVQWILEYKQDCYVCDYFWLSLVASAVFSLF